MVRTRKTERLVVEVALDGDDFLQTARQKISAERDVGHILWHTQTARRWKTVIMGMSCAKQ